MVSVIINNYNYGRYIAEAIDSVLVQDYPDYELIIIDGNSEDDSREVISGYLRKYPNIITTVFKPTSGQAAALNVGWKLAKGDVLAFLDSDDYWFPNKLSAIAELHKKHNAVAHFYKKSDINSDIDYSGELLEYLNNTSYYLKKYGMHSTGETTTSTLSLTKKLADIIFPLPEEEYITFADSYLKLMMSYYDEIRFVADRLTFYRVHGSNAFVGKNLGQRHLVGLLKRNTERLNARLAKEKLPLLPVFTRERFRKLLAEIGIVIEKNAKYVIYGAGALGVETLRIIEAFGGEVLYFCDSNSSRVSELFCGKRILSPQEVKLRRNEYELIHVASMYYKEMIQTLEELELNFGTDYIYCKIGMGYPLPDE